MTAKYRGLNFVAGRGRGFGPGLINKILFFPSLLGAVLSSLKLVRQFRPSVLICFGGFMSLGPAIACKLCGIPVLVHEANRRPGKAVRLIARFANPFTYRMVFVLKIFQRNVSTTRAFRFAKKSHRPLVILPDTI
ncbi:MAG: hypothetical protein EBQ49_06700 [Verrucomicrobia bacterium]|nr:hypothetical protein [Verrucomicrobiota bacterium]